MRVFKTLLFLPIALLLGGCPTGEIVEVDPILRVQYSPVFMSRQQLESSIQFQSEARTPVNAGKIMIYSHYFFVNELHEGFHVYDVSDMTAPVALGFLRVPGSMDIAAKNGYLYVDNAVDLVTLTFDNGTVTEVHREVEALLALDVPQGGSAKYPPNPPEDAVIVGWQIQ